MGLFDQVVGALTGNSSSAAATGETAAAPIGAAAIIEMLAAHEGGLSGIMQKFQGSGLGDTVQSWVGNGQNMPISGDMVHQVLGSDIMQSIAAKTGLPLDQVSDMVAQHLPGVVDEMTPNGQVPAGGSDLMAMGASLLKKRFGIG